MDEADRQELTDRVDGFLKGKRYLIHDRDPLPRRLRGFTHEFRGVLQAAGVTCLKIPAHSPNLHAYAERFALSIKSECLSRLVPLGEGHLRRAVTEFVEHYHLERNHQGLDNRLLSNRLAPSNDNSPVVRRERLGGLLNELLLPSRLVVAWRPVVRSPEAPLARALLASTRADEPHVVRL